MQRRALVAIPAVATILFAATLSGVSAANADPLGPCDAVTPCIERFEVSGAPELWTVPGGVTSVELTVAGGEGGAYFTPGGAGGTVTATVPVQPGDELALMVGAAGQLSNQGGAGGFGGGGRAGGAGGQGGGGGGGSFVFAHELGVWAPLLVAGGGGGGAYDHTPGVKFGGDGGMSGGGADASQDPLNHAAGATETAAGYAGGTAATFDGATFVPGQGQDSGANSGNGRGGGGGGFFGGAAPQLDFYGGGGGSGFAGLGVIVELETPNTAAGFIELEYVANGSAVELSAPSEFPVGSSLSVTGTVRQFASGGTGMLTFDSTPPTGPAEPARTSPVVISATTPFDGFLQQEYKLTAPGEYEFSLSYSGDTIFTGAEAIPLAVQAVPRQVAVELSSSAAEAIAGGRTTLTAAVTDDETEPTFAGFPALTGEVAFSSNGALIGTAPVVAGVAVFEWTPQTSGAHAIEALYSGDERGYEAASDALEIDVHAPATVDPKPVALTPELASTGVDSSPAAGVALALLAAAAALLMVHRRRSLM